MDQIANRLSEHLKTIKRNGIRIYFNGRITKIKYAYKRFSREGSADNDGRWAEIHNKYKGKRVFLIGNGPSLNKTPLYLLKNEYKMCFNRFYLMMERLNWKADFYTIVDNLVLTDIVEEFYLVENNADNIFLPDIHVRGEEYYKIINTDSKKIFWLNHRITGAGFSARLPKVYGGGSVIYEGMQVARHLGFGEIVLLGVDMNYVLHESVTNLGFKTNDIQSTNDDDPNHFDPRYFGKGRKYHQPERYVVDRIMKSLKYVSVVMKQNGFKVVNAGYDSKVGYFEKKDLRSLLQLTVEQEKSLFEECVRSHTAFESVEEIERAFVKVTDISTIDPSSQSFYTDLDYGLTILKEILVTHLPLGPFREKLYFQKR